jgi:thiamine-monophosphate kinase
MTEGYALAKSGAVTSCMDISDGLAQSLFQLSAINQVGFELLFDEVPLAPEALELAEKLSIPVEDLSIYFGGDYELVVTVKNEEWDIAADAVAHAGSKLTQIGYATDKLKLTMIKDGIIQPLENRGYEHFKWEE